MSAVDNLRDLANGAAPKPSADSLCDALTGALGLAEKGRHVSGAAVYGRGPNASVDVILDDGQKLTFERFADIAKPGLLSAYLVTLTGIYKPFKGAEAGQIAATVHQLAKHLADEGDDDIILDCATEFLRLAPTLDVTMGDQADRWRAFRTLATDDAALANPEDRRASAIATRSTVLRDVDSGRQLVRSGWFQSYVRADVGGVYSPAQLAVRVQRIGWIRASAQGRVKATCPSDGRSLAWAFYVVPPDWQGPPVTASYGSNARVRACARKTVTPAVTRNFNGDVQ